MIRAERNIPKNEEECNRVALVSRALACVVIGLLLAATCFGSDTAYGDLRADRQRHEVSKALDSLSPLEGIGGKVQVSPENTSENTYRPVITLESQNGLQLTIIRSDGNSVEPTESSGERLDDYSLETAEGEGALHAEGACEACDALREMHRQGVVSNLYNFLLLSEKVLPDDRFDFHLPVSDEERVAVLQCQDGILTECDALHNGRLSVSSDYLSPFGIVDGDHFSNAAELGIKVKGARHKDSDEEVSKGIHVVHYAHDNEDYSTDNDKAMNGVQNSPEQASGNHMSDDSKTSEDSFDSGLATIRTIIIIAGIGALLLLAGFAWEKFKYSRFLKACGLDKELGQKK